MTKVSNRSDDIERSREKFSSTLRERKAQCVQVVMPDLRRIKFLKIVFVN